jgi:peptide/nickel transport system permease protein
MLAVVVALAVIGPWLSPFAYDQLNPADMLTGPNGHYWLGTDEYGRDVLTRTLVGTRVSLFLGFTSTLVSLVLGVPLGLAAGYAGRKTDEVIMRLLDLMMSFPPIMLALLVLTVTEPSLMKLAIVVGVLFVPAIARITRSVTLDLGTEEFITAALARGETPAYILFREILPNAWPPIIVEGSLRVTFAILVGAVLSFLGLGVQPPAADWGLMISQGRTFLDIAPWIALTPGAAMGLTVVAVNLLGDGLREYLDPRAGRRSHT